MEVGVLGAGEMGQTVLRHLRGCPQVDDIVAYDVEEERIREVRDGQGVALKGIVRQVCVQLRICLRRRFHRKRSQYSRRWADQMFHDTYKLYTVAQLLERKRANAYS